MAHTDTQIEYIVFIFCFRKIRYDYHFEDMIYVTYSSYWIEDIYKLGIHFRLPSAYVHSIVGCGLDYAMHAFNGTSSDLAFYRQRMW